MKMVNADDLKKELSKAPVWTALAVKEMIDEMTNTQVRCKECKWDKAQMIPKEVKCIYQHNADDYCSYGEREGE